MATKTDRTRDWVDLPCQSEPAITAMFEASCTVQVNDGAHTFFWTDKWLNGKAIKDLAPTVFQAVGKRTRKTRLVADALQNAQWRRDIRGGLSSTAIAQYLQLSDLIEQITLSPGIEDRMLWKWTSDHKYSASSAYRASFVGRESFPGTRELWKSKAPGKCKFFVWLAIYGRCWTSDRLQRHNLPNQGPCVLCVHKPPRR